MIRVAGSGKSRNMPSSAPSPFTFSSSSTLSPLAPPFTVDRSLPAVPNPSSLPPPPPSCSPFSKSAFPRPNPSGTTGSYFTPSGDSVYPPPSSAGTAASSRLGNLSSVIGAVEAAPYYPYYSTMREPLDGSLGKRSDYNSYVGGWNGQYDVEKGIPHSASLVNSSWMDPSPCSQMSLSSHKRGSAESFSAHEESFGSWHGAHNESSSVLGHVGSECSEWLDDRHLGIYVDCNSTLTNGSHVTELDSTMWPNEGSSYFYSPETTSIVKECIPSSYDRYISQLVSSSRDPIAHYPPPTSLSRHGYAPSTERNVSMLSTFSKHGNSVVNHVNLQKKDDDHAVGMRLDVSMYDHADLKEGICGNAIWKDSGNSGTSGSPLLVKSLSSGNSLPLGQFSDCLQDVMSGFKVANLSCYKPSNSEIGSFLPDECDKTSLEIHDHLNVAVDSPCWKGASMSRGYPFSSDEILEPLIVGVTSGSDSLVQGPRSSKIQSDIKQDGSIVCCENEKDIHSSISKDLSPVTDLSGLDVKLQNTGTGRVSNPAKVHNSKEAAQKHIHGEYNGLIEKVCSPEGNDNHVSQLCQAECVICEGSSNAGQLMPAVQNSELGANHISNSPNYPFQSKTCTSNNKIILTSPDVISSNELKQAVSSNASSKCFFQGNDTRALVKTMLGLSEVLLCHYCNDNDSFKEDLKPVRKIINNLESVLLRSNKDITEGFFQVPRVEEVQLELKESNADMSCSKNLKVSDENMNLIRTALNNEKHDNIVMKSFMANSEESDKNAQFFRKDLKSDLEQEEDPKMLLYKNLWMQTEAALCSLKHDVALMKLEMGGFKHQFKGAMRSQTLSEGPAEPSSHGCNEHQASNRTTTSVDVSNPRYVEAERNYKQNIMKKDEDASVIARFRILKNRHEADFACADAPHEIITSSSYVDTIEKGVLRSHNAKETTVTSSDDIPTEKFLGLDYRMGNGLFLNNTEPSVVQESHISTSDGSMIQSYNPKNNVKWLLSSGSDSHSSEWEHVPNDEFLW